MRAPLHLDDLVRLSGIPAPEIERYRERGLLDPDGQGDFDEYDLLRLRLIMLLKDRGLGLEEIADGIQDGSLLDALTAQLLFRQGIERFTVEEAAQRSGLSAEQVRALRTAIGIPGQVLSTDDVEALRAVRTVLDAGLPFEAVLEVGRVAGDALRRLADTEMRIAHFYVHQPLEASGADPRTLARTIQELGDVVGPLLEPLVAYLHRQHLLRAAVEDVLLHLEPGGEAQAPGALEATILFVDLASFTSLVQVHGDEAAAGVLDRFDRLVRAAALQHNGSLVKQIGDAFMLTFADPADAVRFAVALDEAVAVSEHMPAVRVGIHAGPVLYRVGDYVGHTVNLASRVSGLAAANEILLTEPVARAAEAAGLPVEPVGDRAIRGVEGTVALYRVVRRGLRAMRRERDPVCGMLVGDEAAGRLLLGGFEFAFCSQACLRRFLEDPVRYTSASRE